MTKRTHEEWFALIKEFKESNETKKQFAARKGLKASTLSWGLSAHRQGPPNRAAKPNPVVPRRRQRKADAIRFVPVSLPRTEKVGAHSGVEIVLPDLTIRFPSGVEAEYLGAVLLELRALC